MVSLIVSERCAFAMFLDPKTRLLVIGQDL
ncbi:hypothetical protein Gotri_018205 [Gossypium trilobum]|uniref:Uncharacterized protein n=1 Tax=Gossypium trilobum TaxID=34281 RepID=A0A7J9E900_9ROSI|nr:hypothetical protein [Gossypium trilobum]